MLKYLVGAVVLAFTAAFLAVGCHHDNNMITNPPVATSTPVPGGPTATPVPGMPTPTPMPPGAPTPTPMPGGGATEMVQVGTNGGFVFVDQKSGTSTSTIHVGDTVQWVWVSGFHSTTS